MYRVLKFYKSITQSVGLVPLVITIVIAVIGIASVSRFLFGISRKTFEKWSAARTVSLNNERALVVPDEHGVYMLLIPYVEDGKLLKIFLVRNPDKIFLGNPVTK